MNEPVFNLLRPVTEDKEDDPGPGPEAGTSICTEDTEAGHRGSGITRMLILTETGINNKTLLNIIMVPTSCSFPLILIDEHFILLIFETTNLSLNLLTKQIISLTKYPI